MTAEYRPLESDKLCACGHLRGHHISVMHGDVPCIVLDCGCAKFTAASEVSVG